MKEYVILVDQQDQEIGTEEKLKAHREGKLHRAFSVFLFDQHGSMLIHQRAFHKYHSGGLWTNACCSHPRPGEPTALAAARRLKEELGITTNLTKAFSFIYKVHLKEDNLFEYEFDHVFFGISEHVEIINPDEVAATRWISIPALKEEITQNPSQYTYWFRTSFNDVLKNAELLGFIR